MQNKKDSISLHQKSGVRFDTLGINCVLLLLAAWFFALPQPNLASSSGFPIIAYFAFVPAFILIRRISFKASFIWGALYGTLSYCIFTYWLAVFHPLAMYVIGTLYFIYYLMAIPLLKLADILFPKKGYIVQWLIWIGYEYLKTLGFNGYSYGVIGYSQWTWPVITQIASIFGVWGVSALVVFPSAWIAGAIKPFCTGPVSIWFSGFGMFARENFKTALIWLLALTATILYGIFSPVDYSAYDTYKIALIQPNSDPWQGGLSAYSRDFTTLSRLSDQALSEEPGIQLVVWPETAFIPRIDWHYRYREDRDYFELVSRFLDYVDKAPVPFVVGNDDALIGRNSDGLEDRLDYNAVLLFKPGENVIPPRPERYWKMHLVPFTEHFPYKKQFPWMHELLVATDTHFWEKGTKAHVFTTGPLNFSTPVCFEDTFGYISRRFVNNGARAIVNLTNDAWAKSLPSQYQHLSMAVFRAVENRVPLLRSTASGQTAYVDPNGRVVKMADPFAETWITADVPLINELPPTLYRIWGDLWGILFAVSAALVLLIKLLTKLRKI